MPPTFIIPIRTDMTRIFWVEIISCLFIFLFVYAAVSKLMDYQKFQIQIAQSPMLTNYASYLAWFIPVIELIIAGMLVFTRTRLQALFAFLGLMTMFTTYIVLASRFSDYVPCSCGGVIQTLSWTQHLIFNMVFLVLGMTAILLQQPPGSKHIPQRDDVIKA